MSNWRLIPGWECNDGTPDEDHDWRLVAGDPSVGEPDEMECAQCGKTRQLTEEEMRDSDYHPEDEHA